MNNTIKEYILDLIENNNHELQYVIKDYDNNKIKDNDPRFVRVLTIDNLLKQIFKEIVIKETFKNGI